MEQDEGSREEEGWFVIEAHIVKQTGGDVGLYLAWSSGACHETVTVQGMSKQDEDDWKELRGFVVEHGNAGVVEQQEDHEKANEELVAGMHTEKK